MGKNVTEAVVGASVRRGPADFDAAPHDPHTAPEREPVAYLLLTYFSRRICGTANPVPLSASKHASTMFGLPHR